MGEPMKELSSEALDRTNYRTQAFFTNQSDRFGHKRDRICHKYDLVCD
jgi:hypothetical protein